MGSWALRTIAAGVATAAAVACSSSPSHPNGLGDCDPNDAGKCSVSMGGGSGGSGSGGEGGTEAGACGNSSDVSQCDQCADEQCCSELQTCGNSTDCEELLECVSDCATDACITDCENQHPASRSSYQSLVMCADVHCKVCTESGVGDPCGTSGYACVAGTSCTGSWCTKTCASDSECAGVGPSGDDIQDEPNACVHGTCYPGCTSDTQCAAYPGTSQCEVANDISGAQVQVCVIVSDAGMP